MLSGGDSAFRWLGPGDRKRCHGDHWLGNDTGGQLEFGKWVSLEPESVNFMALGETNYKGKFNQAWMKL